MDKTVYIHYGADHYDPEKVRPITNEPYFSKPRGGLWASRVDATRGWKDWCETEEYERTDFAKSFRFTFKPGSVVYVISTLEDLFALPPWTAPDQRCHALKHQIDFEQCLKNGIDAIELCWYGEEWADIRGGNLHFEMYGWDCDSVLVMNPDAIDILGGEEHAMDKN